MTNELIIERISKSLTLQADSVRRAVELLDEGNTVPFIARYRKEVTGGMSDEDLRELSDKLRLYRNLEETRSNILRHLRELEVLTPDLETAVSQASTATELEDIYRPYRPKKRTRAIIAREKGLEGLAEYLLSGGPCPYEEALVYLKEEKNVMTVDDALAGARDIIAEIAADEPLVRQRIRELIFKQARISSSAAKEEASAYEMYYNFSEALQKAQPHRILAMNRGEKEGYLRIELVFPEELALQMIQNHYQPRQTSDETLQQLDIALKDSWKRLLSPSLEREVRSVLTARAEEQALKIFHANLRGLLLTPPVKGKRILGLDPGYRTGCKLACVDETGKLLETAVIYPTPPNNKKDAAARVVRELITKYNLNLVAIGNGTAGRESEAFVAEVLADLNRGLEYTIVSEAGASVYSASKLGQAEFPKLDVAERSAVSIARRVQDTMAELVKIDPKAIGIGQYQHDVNQKRLAEVLDGTVESAVNQVGVDLTTASAALLERVAGINKAIAGNIVAYRKQNGVFKARSELKKVPKLGPASFKQCAGFLRLPDGEEYLDRSAVHPESYDAAKKLMQLLGISKADLGNPEAIPQIDVQETAKILGIGEPTLCDILDELKKPGRDPREAAPKPVFKKGVLEMADLKDGMLLTGVVRNVVDFGAFVDIGVHQDGLVHISQLSRQYVRHPLDVVKVGDVLDVKVLSVDLQKKRISLTCLF